MRLCLNFCPRITHNTRQCDDCHDSIVIKLALSDKLDVPLVAYSLLSAKIGTTNTLPRMSSNTLLSFQQGNFCSVSDFDYFFGMRPERYGP